MADLRRGGAVPGRAGDGVLVLGIDPGTVRAGFGVIRAAGPRVALVEYGTLAVARRSGDPLEARLLRLAEGVEELLRRLRPDVVALEEAFFGKSVQSALRIGEARGVVLVAAARAGIAVAQYPPARVKKAVVGDGGAVKERVQEMVRLSLGLKSRPEPADAADALAIALCHALGGSLLDRLGAESAAPRRQPPPLGEES